MRTADRIGDTAKVLTAHIPVLFSPTTAIAPCRSSIRSISNMGATSVGHAYLHHRDVLHFLHLTTGSFDYYEVMN